MRWATRHWDQVLVFATGAPAVAMTQIPGPWQAYACFLGLAGQVGWFRAAWVARQWGIFAVNLLYTASWLAGLWRYWVA